jgi:hypothetical protein
MDACPLAACRSAVRANFSEMLHVGPKFNGRQMVAQNAHHKSVYGKSSIHLAVCLAEKFVWDPRRRAGLQKSSCAVHSARTHADDTRLKYPHFTRKKADLCRRFPAVKGRPLYRARRPAGGRGESSEEMTPGEQASLSCPNTPNKIGPPPPNCKAEVRCFVDRQRATA